MAGHNGVRELLDRPLHLPDALVFTDDYGTRGGVTALLEAGLRIPEDVQVVGWVNQGHSPALQRELTRIEVPVLEFGRLAAELVMRVLAAPQEPPEPVMLGVRFVVGQTTRPAPGSLGASQGAADGARG